MARTVSATTSRPSARRTYHGRLPQPGENPGSVLVAPDGINVDAAGTYFASTLFPDGNSTAPPPRPQCRRGRALIGAHSESDRCPTGVGSCNGSYSTWRERTRRHVRLWTHRCHGRARHLSGANDHGLVGRLDRRQLHNNIRSSTGHCQRHRALHFSVASTNSTLVPASVATAGSPGITVSPSNCGTATLTCSLTVTAAQYQEEPQPSQCRRSTAPVGRRPQR